MHRADGCGTHRAASTSPDNATNNDTADDHAACNYAAYDPSAERGLHQVSERASLPESGPQTQRADDANNDGTNNDNDHGGRLRNLPECPGMFKSGQDAYSNGPDNSDDRRCGPNARNAIGAAEVCIGDDRQVPLNLQRPVVFWRAGCSEHMCDEQT